LSSGHYYKYMEEQTVQNKEIKSRVIIVAVSLLLANSACAFDMGNMMNPSKWTGGNNDNDRYDDYRGGPGYGYGGGPGYGGAPGYGYGGGPGYGGAPGYGYGGDPGYGGAPGYGYGGAPDYGGATTYGAPGTESREAEIRRLKERLRQLESGPR
jgi:hypothetical protein